MAWIIRDQRLMLMDKEAVDKPLLSIASKTSQPMHSLAVTFPPQQRKKAAMTVEEPG